MAVGYASKSEEFTHSKILKKVLNFLPENLYTVKSKHSFINASCRSAVCWRQIHWNWSLEGLLIRDDLKGLKLVINTRVWWLYNFECRYHVSDIKRIKRDEIKRSHCVYSHQLLAQTKGQFVFAKPDMQLMLWAQTRTWRDANSPERYSSRIQSVHSQSGITPDQEPPASPTVWSAESVTNTSTSHYVFLYLYSTYYIFLDLYKVFLFVFSPRNYFCGLPNILSYFIF